MTQLRRRQRRAMPQWTIPTELGFLRHQIETGRPLLDIPQNAFTFASDEHFQATWDQYRDEILADWIRVRPGTRPYAWWRFDSPEPRDETESEFEYLLRHRLMDDAEQSAFEKRKTK